LVEKIMMRGFPARHTNLKNLAAISRDVRLGISHAKKPLKVVHGLECHREGSAIDSFILT
jgi:hypothetical protein